MFRMYLSLFPDLYRNEKIHVFRLIHFISKCSHTPHSPRETILHFIWKCTYHFPLTCSLKPHFSAIMDDFNGHHSLRKIDWKFRVDIIVQCLWLTQEWSTEDDMSSMNAHRQNLLSLRLSFRQYSRHTTYFKWYWVCCYTNTSPRQIHLCLTWACSEPSIFCFCSVR